MFTDMVGSTAAAQANEAQSLRLREEQERLVRPLFAAHRGREIKSLGDGFLAEFDSALHAVQCGIDIQQHLHERNAQPGVVPLLLRIGIHLGDVEQREDDIFGDAVNIASRIEPLSAPGGVCITGEVYSQVRNKLPNPVEKLPPTPLKGVRVPIEAYRISLPWTARSGTARHDGPPRVAILPFTNMSPDPSDLYFADGLTEELITVLSQVRDLRVIARTSVMQYKGTTKSISEIGTELGVASVLEGSVRRAGNRLRITAQLIEVESQEHLWAKSYDRDLDDVFVVQSEIAQQVAEALKVQLRPAETARLGASAAVLPESFVAYLKGRVLLQSVWSRQVYLDAKEQFELAIRLDPENGRAHAGLADAILYLYWNDQVRSRVARDPALIEHAYRALEIDPGSAEAHCALGGIHWDDWNWAAAEKEFQLAIALNPSYAFAHYHYGHLLMDEGRGVEALPELELASQLDPTSVMFAAWNVFLRLLLRRLDEVAPRLERLKQVDKVGEEYFDNLGWYHYSRGEFEAALQAAQRSTEITHRPVHALYMWVYAATGRRDEAWEAFREMEALPERYSRDNLAFQRAHLGDLDGCFKLLEVAVSEHQLGLQFLRNEASVAPMRADPRFAQILKRMNFASA